MPVYFRDINGVIWKGYPVDGGSGVILWALLIFLLTLPGGVFHVASTMLADEMTDAGIYRTIAIPLAYLLLTIPLVASYEIWPVRFHPLRLILASLVIGMVVNVTMFILVQALFILGPLLFGNDLSFGDIYRGIKRMIPEPMIPLSLLASTYLMIVCKYRTDMKPDPMRRQPKP